VKVFPYWGTQIGFGFAIWETGAEIFLPYIMLRLMYRSNRWLRILLRPLLWFKDNEVEG